MLEKDIENLIAEHPDDFFPGEGFKLIGQQHTVQRRRIDILFEDKHERRIIVEVKRGILTREASGQIAEYYGLLKSKDVDGFLELILCANIIPKERRLFLENIGIECKELGISFISELARKYSYTFIDDRTAFARPVASRQITRTAIQALEGQETTVWIFQANPHRYDIVNALLDDNVGNNTHWLVNQHRHEIRKGHLGLIWISGAEAGIYAVVRIESNPHVTSEFPAEKKYWVEETAESALRVEMVVLKRLINRPILRKTLLNIQGLSNLSILRRPQGTNFPVKDAEWRIIVDLLP